MVSPDEAGVGRRISGRPIARLIKVSLDCRWHEGIIPFEAASLHIGDAEFHDANERNKQGGRRVSVKAQKPGQAGDE